MYYKELGLGKTRGNNYINNTTYIGQLYTRSEHWIWWWLDFTSIFCDNGRVHL